MEIAEDIEEALDYRICRYGQSRADFRGPKKPLDGDYVAVLGGSECFGKFVQAPFPDLLESALDERVINLGVMNAGLTLIRGDPAILPIAAGARMTVVQVLGAGNMSNRFYSVHPRRNDRFVSASLRLQRLFGDVDFTEFNFTGHLLTTLEEVDKTAFSVLLDELRTAWVSRMRAILDAIPGEKVLLWMSGRAPEDQAGTTAAADPLFVDRDMLESLAPQIAGTLEVFPSATAKAERLTGKVFLKPEAQAAAAMPGPAYHAEVAEVLARAIARPGVGTGLGYLRCSSHPRASSGA